ncbi:MAG: hypothetical protein ABIN80_30750 [Dyadobacter sp.]|uniref:hypothetical protein n=1 Tax=Dyadobacter sp. TaxID=1914288 RepID=UPI0032652158
MKSIDLVSLVSIVGILLYFIIAAQGAFYHFGFGKALYNISSENFIELRKAVDPIVRGKFKVVYLSALAVMFLWFVLIDKSGGFWSYAPIVIALLLLITDLFLIVKFSEPINELVNSNLLNTKESFVEARDQWLKFILIRGYLSISGFVLLLLHLVLKVR